jgi:beta-N-acetylhexosaminidase
MMNSSINNTNSELQLPLGPVMLDVAGLTLSADEAERFRNPLVGGVILFARNFKSREQVAALCAQIHALRSPGLLIAVDHEGGRVQRFQKGFTQIPSMRSLGQLWMKDALLATRVATSTGLVLAAELRQVGVDFTFAPVLDLDYGESSVIGDRAFHSDARVVTLLAKSINHGFELAGMKNCGKHFPGHGYVRGDSHHEIPVDDRELEDILGTCAAPYDWLGSPALAAVMPAHVVYTKVDKNPAGFSKFWLQTILRKRFAFDGVIFSDDLSMEGASVVGGTEDRANAALKAGCDMILVCNAPAMAVEVLTLPLKINADSSRRITSLLPSGPIPDETRLKQARKDIALLV